MVSQNPHLTRLYHQAARLCLGLSYRDHATSALRALHWFPIRERIRFKLALLMYKACTDHLPSYLSSMVTPCSSFEGRSCLRSASNGKYVVLGTRLVFGRLSFTVAGPSIWNSIPSHFRNSLNETIFRCKLKTHLFSSTIGFPASVCSSAFDDSFSLLCLIFRTD